MTTETRPETTPLLTIFHRISLGPTSEPNDLLRKRESNWLLCSSARALGLEIDRFDSFEETWLNRSDSRLFQTRYRFPWPLAVVVEFWPQTNPDPVPAAPSEILKG